MFSRTRLAVLPQYVYPKQAMTIFAGWVANARAGAITTWIIKTFVAKYQVDMQEAADPDIRSYGSFNEFFTRALRSDARPLAAAAYVCPVDGAISQFGPIRNGQIFQAKGHDYSATALLGGDRETAAHFADGQFATIYLSPRDYHRIHMPCAGRLTRMIYVPGELFSVNPVTARGVPGLFARNERVVCLFEGEHGPFAMVLVGATIVGSMQTVWHGVVNPPRGEPRDWRYDGASQPVLAQGEEMGRFRLGSTVVLLFPKDTLRFDPRWKPEGVVRLNQSMGELPAA